MRTCIHHHRFNIISCLFAYLSYSFFYPSQFFGIFMGINDYKKVADFNLLRILIFGELPFKAIPKSGIFCQFYFKQSPIFVPLGCLKINWTTTNICFTGNIYIICRTIMLHYAQKKVLGCGFSPWCSILIPKKIPTSVFFNPNP